MIHSPSLLVSADSLRHLVALIESERDATHSDARLLADASGAAPDSLRERITDLDHLLNDYSQQVAHVSNTLTIAADLLKPLEHAVEYLDRFTDYSPIAWILIARIRALAETLDIACAHHISSLCTPALEPAPVSWATYPDASIDAIHELLLIDAPPHIRDLCSQHPDLRLLETPDGGLVAAVGDLETAPTVTTFVPGVNSSDPATWSHHIDRARNLGRATGGTGIVWLGYNAPPGVAPGIRRQPARDGADDLRAFQRELGRRYPDKRKIVTGYSYGSVVAGQAAREGLVADDLVFIGSPGTTADHVDEFHLESDHPRVHAFTTKQDAIRLVGGPYIGIHGPDPTSPDFGANVWDSDYSGSHTSYFDSPEFLRDVEHALREP